MNPAEDLATVLERIDRIGEKYEQQLSHLRMESHRQQAVIAEQARRLRQAEGGLFREAQLPIVNRLAAVIDGLDRRGESTVPAASVRDELLELLDSLDIAPVTVEDFDPRLHVAMTTSSDPSLPDGRITEVWNRGYARGDAVFRHAKVVVNRLDGVPGAENPPGTDES